MHPGLLRGILIFVQILKTKEIKAPGKPKPVEIQPYLEDSRGSKAMIYPNLDPMGVSRDKAL